MILLAQTYTAKAMHGDILRNAVSKAQEELGEATLLEVAAALAFGDCITKASDLSGRKALPKSAQYIVQKLVKTLKVFSKNV